LDRASILLIGGKRVRKRLKLNFFYFFFHKKTYSILFIPKLNSS
jgi:hypothetical protein